MPVSKCSTDSCAEKVKHAKGETSPVCDKCKQELVGREIVVGFWRGVIADVHNGVMEYEQAAEWLKVFSEKKEKNV